MNGGKSYRRKAESRGEVLRRETGFCFKKGINERERGRGTEGRGGQSRGRNFLMNNTEANLNKL